MGKNLLRSSPPPEKQPPHQSLAESAVQECMSNINTVITKWTSPSSEAFLFSSNRRREAEEFVKAVKHLQSTMHRLVAVNPSSEKLVYAQKLMQSAMKLLESEFRRVLNENRDYLDPESVSVRSYISSRFSTSTTTSVSDDSEDEISYDENTEDRRLISSGDSDAMDDLKTIADCMISTGYAKECVRVYKTVRRSIVDEMLRNLAVERLTLHQAQKMDWETLDSKIKSWLRAAKLAVRSLFFGERLLADHVFSSSVNIVESSFTDITQEGALTLFTFPENAAKIKKLSPEKMFRFLDMYETLANLYVEIETIFYFDSAAAVRSQVVNSLARLGDAVRFMMTAFETAIQKDASKSPVTGGGVHPLTRYVMNYLSFLVDYSDSIAVIFENWQPSPLTGSCGGDDAYPEEFYSSPVSVRIAWVILLTLCKIDGKAQPYKDVALSYLFLANNLQYVVVKVRTSSLKLLLGEDWVVRHEAKVKQYADKFEKLAWGKVLTSLPEYTAEEMTSEEAKVLFARFNDEFEAAYRKQVSWVIPDPKLRDRIKVSLSQKLMLVCTELYEINRIGLGGDAVNVRYTPEDIGNYLSDLYFGSRGSGAAGSVSTKGSGSGTGSSTTGKSRGGRSH